MVGLALDRRRALEEAFLRRAPDPLRAKLRPRSRRRSREELGRVCGVSHRDVLDDLLRVGLTPGAIAAFALVPILAVAWATGRVEAADREAWLDGARKSGIEDGTAASELLAAWLSEPPDRELFEAWTRFTKALCDHLEDARRERLRERIVGRARAVAEAAGGERPTPEEERELVKLAKAF